MATLHHQVWIDAPVSKVYGALATADGLGTWWAPHTSTETEDGLILSHNPGPEHGEVKLKVLDRIPDRRVEWEVVSTHPPTSPAFGWMGTRILFELDERDNPGTRMGVVGGGPRMTVLDLRHSGWDEESEYFGFCTYAWGLTMLMLKDGCEGRRVLK